MSDGRVRSRSRTSLQFRSYDRIERASVLTETPLDLEHLPASITGAVMVFTQSA